VQSLTSVCEKPSLRSTNPHASICSISSDFPKAISSNAAAFWKHLRDRYFGGAAFNDVLAECRAQGLSG